MLGRRENQHKARTASAVVVAMCLFTACASSEVQAPKAENSTEESALLLGESAPVATEVSDAGAFADLEANKEITASATDSAATTPVVAAAEDGSPYYNSIGGESLRKVAHTLYSDKSFASQLLEKNPELKGIKKLAAEQKVYFDIDTAKPEPTYLTKDLLDRYPGQLADRVNAVGTAKGIAKTTVTLNKGETLQGLSMRLYGTHRYWTEIFLVNHDKIQNYDRVKSGITLSVFERPNSGVAAATQPVQNERPVVAKPEAPTPPPVVASSQPAPTPVPVEEPVVVAQEAPVAMPTQPVVATTQPTPTPVDPIPETPPVAEKTIEPAPVPEAPKPTPVVATAEISSSNSMTRPIIYGVLVLLIIGGGVYFTRSPKKSKVDMLDITAADGAGRPKLAKDSQKSNIG